MNLALQKRHEQLERWRQNEANAELEEQQQQQKEATSCEDSSWKKSQFTSSQQSDELTSGSSFPKFKTVQTGQNSNISQNQFAPTTSANKIPSPLRTSRLISSASERHAQTLKTFTDKSKLRQIGGYVAEEDLEENEKVVASAVLKENRQKPQQRKQQQVKFSNSTLFLNACANGDLDECKRLLESEQVDINVTTCDGLTGLHEAAICGNGELVEFLLSRGANIDCCDNEGWTPLHAAASLGQTSIVQLLLQHQSDVTIVNCENFLAFDLARNDEVRELISEKLNEKDIDQLRKQEELLIEEDIKEWIRTCQYNEKFHPATQATVLHVCAAKGYVKLMKLILETPSLKKQVELEAKDNEGFTPLLAASFWNQTDIVELLIEHGANIFAQSNSGYKISSIVSS